MKMLLFFMSMTLLNLTSATTCYECNEKAYQAYLGAQDPQVVKELWKKVVSDEQTKMKSNPTDVKQQYALALSQFGLLSATMRDKDETLFEEYADKTEENLEAVIDADKKWSEPRALLSALYGLKMGYSPIKGMYLGPKSSNLIEKALKDSPTSPLVWKIYANSKFFTPETFGGDVKEAIRAYEKSIALYELTPSSIKNNWMYLDALAFLGQAYMKDGQSSKAVTVYEKALKTEPNFTWVKAALLPNAKKVKS
jgi:tetratricopeptide (TPR) repeat protein